MKAIIQSSKPYPLFFSDNLGLSFQPLNSAVDDVFVPTENISLSFTPLDGKIWEGELIEFGPEDLQLGFQPQSGVIESVISNYQYGPENLILSFEPQASRVDTIVVSYLNWPVESISLAFTPQSGEII